MARRRIGCREVETSNADKVLFPADGITKGAVIDYYLKVAATLLPHLAGRPLTLQRFPDGIGTDGFYQKAVPDYFPDWVNRVQVATATESQWQVICSDAATLAYLGQQACITPHAWLSRRDCLDRPDRLVFDLDPPDGDFAAVRAAAFRVRALLEQLELPAYVMTTGSRGVHVVVPLQPASGFDAVRDFARRLAAELARRHPQSLTVAQRKRERAGRVYIDTGNNAYGQTVVAPYALRARDGAPVATPLTWEELADRATHARRWTLRSIPRRLGQREDPWARIDADAVSLAGACERLAALSAG